MSLIEDKDRQFHQHIKRNRVDPSTQSTTNPVPDFYGECTPTLAMNNLLGHDVVARTSTNTMFAQAKRLVL
jgi:hypothetical protein